MARALANLALKNNYSQIFENQNSDFYNIKKITIFEKAKSLEDALKFFEEFSEYHPKDAWYLAFIAVDPSKQGSGKGSFILKEALKMIDEKKERAYLEASSERNMSLYERHGFECIGKIQINDSPPAFPMIRESKN